MLIKSVVQILGREVGNIYSRSELKHLIQIHVENPEHQVCASFSHFCIPPPHTTLTAEQSAGPFCAGIIFWIMAPVGVCATLSSGGLADKT